MDSSLEMVRATVFNSVGACRAITGFSKKLLLALGLLVVIFPVLVFAETEEQRLVRIAQKLQPISDSLSLKPFPAHPQIYQTAS